MSDDDNNIKTNKRKFETKYERTTKKKLIHAEENDPFINNNNLPLLNSNIINSNINNNNINIKNTNYINTELPSSLTTRPLSNTNRK